MQPTSPNKTSPKILIVAPSWIGDMVMAEALLQFLHKQNPQIILDILAPKYVAPILLRMPPKLINKIWLSSFHHGELNIKNRFALAKKLRVQNYAKAIVLPNSWKSALIPFLAGIPKRSGWRGEMRYFLLNDIRILDKKKMPLMLERFIALGTEKNAPLPRPLPFPKLETNFDFVSKTLTELNLSRPQKPILALCIGAEYGEAKRWPAAYFAEVAKQKAKENWEIWLFGSEKDKEIATEIQKQCSNICLDLTAKTSLEQAIDLLSLTAAVITNDSGLMHIAAALQLPLIAIYGSSSPEFTPPLSNKAHILYLHLPCSPCFKRQCPLGHFKCMLELKPDRVLQALQNIGN